MKRLVIQYVVMAAGAFSCGFLVAGGVIALIVGLGIITDFTEYAINFDSVIVADKIVEIAYSICNNVLLEGGKYNIYYFIYIINNFRKL